MSRTFLKFALVAVVGVIATNSADAGFKVSFGGREVNVGPGPYQQKIIRGAIKGGEAGYDATGHWGGAVIGAAAGAGYADHQHNSNKVHNYRTPPVGWQAFHYGQGAFVRHGAGWMEYQNGRPAFYFHEIRRAANYIDLFDATRQVTVRIEPGRALILLPGRPWQFLYSGQNR